MGGSRIVIEDWAANCALGATREAIAQRLFGIPDGPTRGEPTGTFTLNGGDTVPVWSLPEPLPVLPAALCGFESANNRLIHSCLSQIQPSVDAVIARFGAHRVGVVIGSSTSGVATAEDGLRGYRGGVLSSGFSLDRWELGDAARFAAVASGAQGPVYTVSTACTAAAKAMISAARLLKAGVCDAVVTGGADILCGLTLNGFGVLGLLSQSGSNPFSCNRDGVGLGEGGALFLLTRGEGEWHLDGWGESGDAHHASAPDPKGVGMEIALMQALTTAGVSARDVSYVNLHGTGTRLNDAAEARAVHRVMGASMPVSSTKGASGHALGGTAAIEACFTLLAMERGEVLPHRWDGMSDLDMPVLELIDRAGFGVSRRRMASLSAGFGGSNAALVFAHG